VCVAAIPVLWILCRAVIIKSQPLTPEYQKEIISNVQGWKLSNVKTLFRVIDQIDAHQNISDADWNAMVKAVEDEPVGFGNMLLQVICTTYPMEERFRPTVLKWCEKNMGQEKSSGDAVNAYFCYVLAKGPDRDVWKARLVARGGPYPEKITDEEKIIEKWLIKLARLEREAQKRETK